jgi:DDE superfamily endonuclease
MAVAQRFEDEVWWSRVQQPRLHAWTVDGPALHLVEQTVAKKTKRKGTQKALACYGVDVRGEQPDGTGLMELWLRFVDGRPISSVTTQFLAWCGEQTAALGQTALILIWDNAAWHVSAEVRAWLRAYNRQVRRSGVGARLLVCCLPTKSPWLNPIEPKWVHGKRAVVEPAGLLTPDELEERICAYYHTDRHPRLSMPNHLV